MPGTTVLFLGHETSPESRAAFDHLRQTAGGADVRWLLDTARAPVVPQDLESSIIRSDSRRFSEWGFAVHGATMLPGHCHFPVLNYAQQNPGFDWLWTVEYDVRFTGPWRLLFDHFAPCDADLLTCHLRSRRQEPRWHWWDTLQAPEGEVVDAARQRGLRLRRCVHGSFPPARR